jgi:hypothetical protein
MDAPLTTKRAVEHFTPAGSPRSYMIAPLDFHQRIAYRADLTRIGGTYPNDAQLLLAIRAAVMAENPTDLDQQLAQIALAEAEPMNIPAQADLQLIEQRVSLAPIYAELRIQRDRYLATLPWVAVKHALRGWEGPDLPEFDAPRGLVSDACLEALAELDELAMVGWRAAALMTPGKSAVGNSASPSPSPASPAPSTAETPPKTADAGFSTAKNTRKTRAS